MKSRPNRVENTRPEHLKKASESSRCWSRVSAGLGAKRWERERTQNVSKKQKNKMTQLERKKQRTEPAGRSGPWQSRAISKDKDREVCPQTPHFTTEHNHYWSKVAICHMISAVMTCRKNKVHSTVAFHLGLGEGNFAFNICSRTELWKLSRVICGVCNSISSRAPLWD